MGFNDGFLYAVMYKHDETRRLFLETEDDHYILSKTDAQVSKAPQENWISVKGSFYFFCKFRDSTLTTTTATTTPTFVIDVYSAFQNYPGAMKNFEKFVGHYVYGQLTPTWGYGFVQNQMKGYQLTNGKVIIYES